MLHSLKAVLPWSPELDGTSLVSSDCGLGILEVVAASDGQEVFLIHALRLSVYHLDLVQVVLCYVSILIQNLLLVRVYEVSH